LRLAGFAHPDLAAVTVGDFHIAFFVVGLVGLAGIAQFLRLPAHAGEVLRERPAPGSSADPNALSAGLSVSLPGLTGQPGTPASVCWISSQPDEDGEACVDPVENHSGRTSLRVALQRGFRPAWAASAGLVRLPPVGLAFGRQFVDGPG
jgi:hypothetical protein